LSHRRLAAAAGTEQAEELADLDVDAEVLYRRIVDSLQRAIGLLDVVKRTSGMASVPARTIASARV